MQAAGNQQAFKRVRAETRLSSEDAKDLIETQVDHEGEFAYNMPEEEIACVRASSLQVPSLAEQFRRQLRTGVLALGLPSALGHDGLLCPALGRDRLVCDRDDRLLDVQARREGSSRRQ